MISSLTIARKSKWAATTMTLSPCPTAGWPSSLTVVVATAPAAVYIATDAPICHLSIADRDHAIPPARVDVDLCRAPPALLAS